MLFLKMFLSWFSLPSFLTGFLTLVHPRCLLFLLCGLYWYIVQITQTAKLKGGGGYTQCPCTFSNPMGQRALPGMKFSFWNNVAQGPPFSSWQEKTFDHYLLRSTGLNTLLWPVRGQFNTSLFILREDHYGVYN